MQVANVPSHRYLSDVEIELQDYGVVRGDIAGVVLVLPHRRFWSEVNYSNIEGLSSFSVDVMNELEIGYYRRRWIKLIMLKYLAHLLILRLRTLRIL